MSSKKLLQKGSDGENREEAGKENRPRSKWLNRYLATLLIPAGLALASCGQHPGAGLDNDNKDAAVAVDSRPREDAQPDAAVACSNEPGRQLVCGGNVVANVLEVGQKMAFGLSLTLHLEGTEVQNGIDNAIIAIQDNDCNILKKDKFARGNVKQMNINGEEYDITLFDLSTEAGNEWVDIQVAKAGCEEACLPLPGCGTSYQTTIVTLAEGESEVISGTGLRVVEIMEAVGAPQGGTCPIADESASITITTPGHVLNVEMPEGACERSADGCYSVKLLEVTEDVGAPQGTPPNQTCLISNEKARFEIKVKE